MHCGAVVVSGAAVVVVVGVGVGLLVVVVGADVDVLVVMQTHAPPLHGQLRSWHTFPQLPQ